jgi:hypothetical protein
MTKSTIDLAREADIYCWHNTWDAEDVRIRARSEA